MREEMQRRVRGGQPCESATECARRSAAASRSRISQRPPHIALLVLILLWPASATAQPTIDDWNRALAGAALVTHAGDAVSTVRATVTGAGVEANRFARPFVGGDDPKPLAYFGLKFGTAYGSYLLKDWLREKEPKWTLVANVAEVAAFAWVGWHNYKVYERAKQ